MKCAVHPEVDASGYCRNCGKPMCAVCVRPVHEVLYCEECLAHVMGVPAPQAAESVGAQAAPDAQGTVPPPPAVARPGSVSPVLAFILGFIPGLGAIYNGEYNKAIVHIVVFGALILGVSGGFGEGADGFWVFGLVAFIFYMAIDSLRTAKMRQTGVTPKDPIETWSAQQPMGPIILIGVGVLLLLRNFGFFERFRIGEIFWPLVLIGVGFLMLRKRMSGQQ
ncbi:MAG TPA: B-box zinc finger protein [Candidatus Acidoferrum sp.]|nr:B-box zinc finger protein [Candidatus Acidoferrum sp.]